MVKIKVIITDKTDDSIRLCEVDGVLAALVSPEWMGKDFSDIIGAANTWNEFGLAIDKLFPKTDLKGLSLAGALIGGALHVYVTKEGYYKMDNGRITGKILFEGKLYYRNGKIEKG